MASLGLPPKRTVFVEGNFDYKNNYIDMQLMSMCNCIIGGGASSFSFFAALIAPDLKQILQIRKADATDIAQQEGILAAYMQEKGLA